MAMCGVKNAWGYRLVFADGYTGCATDKDSVLRNIMIHQRQNKFDDIVME
ncbi:MAG: hypothetical protein ACLTDF_00140 [Coprococcus sp.]